jgi:hypothetical protein
MMPTHRSDAPRPRSSTDLAIRGPLVDIDALEYLVMRLLQAPAKDFGEVPLPNDEAGRPIVPTEPGLTVGKWLQRL